MLCSRRLVSSSLVVVLLGATPGISGATPPSGESAGGGPGHLRNLIVLAAPDPFVPAEDGTLTILLSVDIRRAVLMADGPVALRLEIEASVNATGASPEQTLTEVVPLARPATGGGFETVTHELLWDGLGDAGDPSPPAAYEVAVKVRLVRETPGVELLVDAASSMDKFELAAVRPTGEVLALVGDALALAEAAGGKAAMTEDERNTYVGLATIAAAGGVEAYTALVDAMIADEEIALAGSGHPLTSAQVDAWRDLLLTEPGQIEVHWNRFTGTPSHIWFGTKSIAPPPVGDTPLAKHIAGALTLFLGLQALYDWGPLDELVFERGLIGETRGLVSFRRLSSGVPVAADAILFVLGRVEDELGTRLVPRLVGSNVSRGVTDAAARIDEALPEDHAIRIALAEVGPVPVEISTQVRLYVSDGGPEDPAGAPSLLYTVVVLPALEGEAAFFTPQVVVLHALTGDVLVHRDAAFHQGTVLANISTPYFDPPAGGDTKFDNLIPVPDLPLTNFAFGGAPVVDVTSASGAHTAGAFVAYGLAPIPIGLENEAACATCVAASPACTICVGAFPACLACALTGGADVTACGICAGAVAACAACDAAATACGACQTSLFVPVVAGGTTVLNAGEATGAGAAILFPVASSAVTTHLWMNATLDFHAGDPLWRAYDGFNVLLLPAGFLTSGACGQYLPPPVSDIRLNLVSSCATAGVWESVILHEEGHFFENVTFFSTGLPVDWQLSEAGAVWSVYSFAEMELAHFLDEAIGGLAPPATSFRQWLGYFYHALLGDRLALPGGAFSGFTGLPALVGWDVVAGTLVQAEMETGIEVLEPIIRMALDEVLNAGSYGDYGPMYTFLRTSLIGWADMAGLDSKRGIDRAFNYHGLLGDPEFGATNPSGVAFDLEGSDEDDPRLVPLREDRGARRSVPTAKGVAADDNDMFVFEAKSGVTYVITVSPDPLAFVGTPWGDPELILLSRTDPIALSKVWCNDNCLDTACLIPPFTPTPPSIDPNTGFDCPAATALYPRIEWRADYTGPAYLRVLGPGGGTYQLNIWTSSPSGTEARAAAAIARSVPTAGPQIPGTSASGTVHPGEPAFVKVHFRSGVPGPLAGQPGGICDDDFTFLVDAPDFPILVEPMIWTVADGPEISLAPPVAVFGLDQPIPVTIPPGLRALSVPGAGVIVLRLQCLAVSCAAPWLVEAVTDAGTCDLSVSPVPWQLHDLSDFLSPLVIPRAFDGGIDPIVATIADTLYGFGPLDANGVQWGGDDDYFQITLREGERVTVRIDPPLFLDVAGPPLSTPGFYVNPAGTSPGGSLTLPWPAVNMAGVATGAIRPAVTPLPIPPTLATPERGYLWSEVGELSLVAFHDGTYTFRVRDNTAFPRSVAYIFTIAAHTDGPDHADLP